MSWYGNAPYDPAAISADLEFMVTEMASPDPAPVTADRVAFMEGGCSQKDHPGRLTFYSGAISTVARLGLAGIFVGDADGFHNKDANTSVGNEDANPEYALFVTSFDPAGVTPFPTPGWSYEDRQYPVFPKYTGMPLSPLITPDFGETFFSSAWGDLSFTSLTTIGEAVQDAFAVSGMIHRGVAS